MESAPIASPSAEAPPSSHKAHWLATSPFYLVHILAVVGVALMGWSWKGLALAVGLYYARMFFVTAGYHRYFAHRTYKTSRFVQFLLAFFAQTSTQKGALWWAAHHRIHHKLSDKPGDVHSMKLEGFWWSHVGWILSTKHEQTEWEQIPDLAKFPELRWLNRFQIVPTLVYSVALFAIGGWFAVVWGYFVSTVLLWHGTFTINSLMHWMGRRRYATTDESRNSMTLALVTLGEGWHNNHHYYPRSTAQGFFWWEIDITFYVLRLLSLFGIVWDLHTPPKKIRDRVAISRRRTPTMTGSVSDLVATAEPEPAPAE